MHQIVFINLNVTAGYYLKAGIYLESLALDDGNDLMGFDDSLDGFEHAVASSSCSFSSVTDIPGFFVSKHSVLRVFSTLFRYFPVPGGTVRGQPPRFCTLLEVAALAQQHTDWQLQLYSSSFESDLHRTLMQTLKAKVSVLKAVL